MTVNMQPTYNVTQPIAYPGMPATMTSWDGDTYIVDKALAGSGSIGFGVACSLKVGTDPLTVVIGGTAALFRGISIRDITISPIGSPVARTAEGYYKGENIVLLSRGDIWVQIGATAGGVNPGDAVKFVTATGVFDSAGTITLANAQWMRGAAASGLALLRLNHPSAV
jgi:hypothetical protein